MHRQLAENHFGLYLLLMSFLGVTLGFVGTLLIYVILAWHSVCTFMYSVFAMGWG